MKKVKYMLVLFLVIFISAVNAQSKKDKAENKKLVKSTFTVKGMTCQGCANTVKNIIKGVDGVSKTNVNLKTGEAAVEYDPDKTNSKSIESKFKLLPYKVVENKTKLNKVKMEDKNGKK